MTTKVNREMTKAEMAKTIVSCPKCWGRGIFRQWSHIAGGMCFTCHGDGKVTMLAAGFYFQHAGR